MRTWLTQFKISNAFDDGGVVRGQASRSEKSDDVRQFERSLQSLDHHLKAAQPRRPVPAGLHDSVMGAVHDVSRARDLQSVPTMLRWLPVPALALLVVAGLWWALSQPESGSQSLVTAAAALQQSHQLTEQAPAAVLAPLSKEMENLNRDLRNAVEYLVASVP